MLILKGNNGSIYPVLLHDGDILILVDTGLPGQTESICEEITRAGFDPHKINMIILTHQDIDHIGCAKALAASGTAEVTAHVQEAPYIDGRETPVKLAAMDGEHPFYRQLKAGFDSCKLNLGVTLSGGDILPYCGGIEVIHTPGHTPGHICLYVKRDKTLIAGDALNIENGSLTGPNPVFTQDLALANESAAKLSGYDISTMLTYHGGRYDGDFGFSRTD